MTAAARRPSRASVKIPSTRCSGAKSPSTASARARVLRGAVSSADPAGRRDRNADEELIHLINADTVTCGIASIHPVGRFWKIGVGCTAAGRDFTPGVAMISIGCSGGGGTAGLVTYTAR